MQYSENVSFLKCLKQAWFFPNVGVKFFPDISRVSNLIFQKFSIEEEKKIIKREMGDYKTANHETCLG